MNQPDVYSENNEWQFNENAYVIENYILKLVTWKRNETIFEIGMGDGKTTMELFLPKLPHSYRKYIGSDLSEEMVEFAKKKYGTDKLPNIEFIPFDAQVDVIPAHMINNFDHVFSFFSFHWLTDVRKALRNIWQLLKPGGETVFSFAESSPMDHVLFNLSKYPKWASYGHDKFISNFYRKVNPREEWLKCLADVGFVGIQVFCDIRTLRFSTERMFEDFYLAVDPVSTKIPPGEKEEYVRDYLREARKSTENCINYRQRETLFHIEFNQLVIFACKP